MKTIYSYRGKYLRNRIVILRDRRVLSVFKQRDSEGKLRTTEIRFFDSVYDYSIWHTAEFR